MERYKWHVCSDSALYNCEIDKFNEGVTPGRGQCFAIKADPHSLFALMIQTIIAARVCSLPRDVVSAYVHHIILMRQTAKKGNQDSHQLCLF